MKSMQRVVVALVALVIGAWSPAYGQTRTFDVRQSTMTVRVYKQGVFSFLADDHVVSAPIVSGSYDEVAKTVELTVDATKMRVLDPSLPAQKRESVQTNMTGPQVLDVAAHPTISFHSTTIDAADPKRWTVTGTLALHGQTHPIAVHVLKTDASHFSGSATIRQTTFGITPIKVAGGAVSVKDDVNIEFEIALTP
jgi:polyisoprenoid-binding protein YceI